MQRKTWSTAVIGTLFSIFLFISCQKEVTSESESTPVLSAAKGKLAPVTETQDCKSLYAVKLENVTREGCNYAWTWSVTNLKPGNGLNGTAQNLSHWGFQLATCVTEPQNSLTKDHIVRMEYKIGETGEWEELSKAIGVDKSQGCETNTVVKFDAGTQGSTPTYYRLVVNADFYTVNTASGYFKSGVNTGCCTFSFEGIGCIKPLCFYSQGYWFAKPQTVWSTPVTFGALTITQEQGKTIWNSHKGNMYGNNNSYAKRALFQATAVQLSVCDINSLPADLKAHYTIVVNFLSTLTYNDLLTGDYDPGSAPQDVLQAIGFIGDYIQNHHCDDDYTDTETM